MSVAAGLSRLARSLGMSRGAQQVLGALATGLIVWALAAALARLGVWAWARWVPALLWLLLVLGVWRVAGRLRRARPASRDVALLVESEQHLRRGSLVGLFDMQAAVPAGTSDELAARAQRQLIERLPADPSVWAPEARRRASRRLSIHASLFATSLILAFLAFWFAGSAAAMLATPVRALRYVLAPRLSISASDRAVPVGATVTVSVQAEAGTPRVALRVRQRGESWHIVMVPLDGAGRATHRLAVGAPTYVFAEAAGTSSDTLSIEVIRPLVLGDFALTAHYPAYLERSEEPLDHTAGVLALPAGSWIDLRGSASAPLEHARLSSPTDTIALRVDRTSFEGRIPVRGDAAWTLSLADTRGGSLPEGPRIEVRSVPDSVPVVSVPVPGGDTTVPLDLHAALVIDARDDHGLERVEIVSWRVSRLGVVGDTLVDSLGGVAGADRVVQTEIMDLNLRGLLPGDTLRVFVRARDRSPAGQWGRSREFALRLRSLAEMREAVRAEADSLSREAAAIAAGQTEVSRETRDLAAQRNRTGERTQTRPADARESSRPNESANMNFEQTAEAQRLAQQQSELLARAESLRTDLQQLAQAARDAGLNDPEFQRQLADLDRLLREALTPELMRRMEELRRALESLDPRQVQDALRRLAEQQQHLREELQRSAELFERAALEGAMQTAAQDAEALQREQEQWAERARQRADSLAAAREQQRIGRSADSLQQRLQDLSERLAQRGESTTAQSMSQAERQVEQARREMQQAQAAMQQGSRGQAGEAGRRAAENLEDVPQLIEQASQQQASNWRSEVLEKLGRATHETVQLAMEQARMAEELRQNSAGNSEVRGRQSAIEQGINQTMRTLQEAAGSNALVSPRLGAMMAQAREQVGRSRQAMEGPSPNSDEAAERASDAARTLASAATQMMRNADEVGSAQSGSGFAEAVERMGRLASQQGQLNDQLGGLLPMLGTGEAIQQQLRLLAERQRQLANQMERLGENMPGRSDQLAEEARQLADRLEQGRLDRATLERQQRLFRRMLDAGRSLRNDQEPEDPERQSRSAQDARSGTAPGAVRQTGLRYPPPAWRELQALSPEERAVVLEYFRRLNAKP